MGSTITVVVAEDHPVTRAGIVTLLQQASGVKVVGEASDGLQVLDICGDLHPQVLLLDLRLPKMDGLLVAHQLSHSYQAPQIIMLSAYAQSALVQAALEAGARGYLLKNATSAEILYAIHHVMLGQQVLIGVERPSNSTHTSLSPQEFTTLSYVARGLSTREIARQMNSSPRTIETYLSRIFSKLGTRNRTQALLIAYRERILPLDEI